MSVRCEICQTFPLIILINRNKFQSIKQIVSCVIKILGTAVAQWLRCCATNRKVAGSIPAGVNGFFNDIKSLRSHYGPGVDSVSNRNEYGEYFLGVKSGRCVRLTTLPPSYAVVTKCEKLNFLEPSGPVQPCNGTAFLVKILLRPVKMRRVISHYTVAQWLRSQFRSQLVSLEFFIDITSHYGPRVDSVSNRNEYQEHFLGGKGGRCIGLTNLPPSCAIVM